MNIQQIINKLSRPFLLSASLIAAACGEPGTAEDAPTPEAAQSETRSPSVIAAGESGVALGVSGWRVDQGFVQGLDENDAVVAEFQLDGDARTIEALMPEPGLHLIDDPSQDTLTPRASALLQAMLADIAAAAGGDELEAEGSVEKAWGYYGCFWNYYDCDARGFQGIYNGWWRYYECRYPTAYCGRNKIAGIWAN